MKKIGIIVLSLILLLMFSNYARAQEGKRLIEDETYYVPSGKTGFRIVTANDSIYKILITKLSQHSYRVVSTIKTDRFGKYWEHSMYFKKEQETQILKEFYEQTKVHGSKPSN